MDPGSVPILGIQRSTLPSHVVWSTPIGDFFEWQHSLQISGACQLPLDFHHISCFHILILSHSFSLLFTLLIFSNLFSAASAYVFFVSFWFLFTAFSNSGAGPSSSASSLQLGTASDALHFQHLHEVEPPDYKSAQVNLTFTLTRTSVTTGRTCIPHALPTCLWKALTSRRETPAVRVIGRPL